MSRIKILVPLLALLSNIEKRLCLLGKVKEVKSSTERPWAAQEQIESSMQFASCVYACVCAQAPSALQTGSSKGSPTQLFALASCVMDSPLVPPCSLVLVERSSEANPSWLVTWATLWTWALLTSAQGRWSSASSTRTDSDSVTTRVKIG